MPLLFSCTSYLSFFLFFVIIFYFPNHPCIARKSQLMPHYLRLPANNKAAQEIYLGTDSSRVENAPRGIADLQKVKKIEAFHKEKNDNKGTISGTEMISPSSLPHARLLKALKTKMESSFTSCFNWERQVSHRFFFPFENAILGTLKLDTKGSFGRKRDIPGIIIRRLVIPSLIP
ncbi:PREDICTED: uncharacterized protein LOC109237087 isoform X1 [Nicotiana attenuata]|uniref:uncharacterized protein LOC109237087 isoform X1 n=1 Tax=Nicotiana attenuata TaxID=49451 RepID=UPI0009046A8C|nr:PREDICTED: uncharacterized protein LOC109237087 isoform X1 [Nicotiana attenuata]